MEKFIRTISLIGEDNFQKIKDLTVAVVGLGGVGGYAVESLVRMGVNHLVIVDYDVVDKSNINRQIIATTDNIGIKKTKAFYNRIKKINPNCEVIALDIKLDDSNYNLLLEHKIDYLIDACDDLKAKELIIKICLDKKIKFISSMGMAKKLHPELLEISDIRKTCYDPIAKKIRKFIKDNNIKDKVIVVSSKEIPLNNDSTTLGSISFVPSVAGLLCTSKT